ncbi:MAG: translocation/assembly module TamB domain-containing protein [bacterium]
MRRAALIGILLLILGIVAAGTALVTLNTSLGSRYVLSLVNSFALEKAGLSLRWRDAKGSYLFNLAVREPVLTSAAGDTVFQADLLRVRYLPWSVLGGSIDLMRVEADRPRFSVSALRGGLAAETEGAARAAADTSAGGGMPRLSVGRVVLRDGKVQILEGGLFEVVENIRFRGGFRMGPEGGLEIPVDHLHGDLEGWGLAITDVEGTVVFHRGRLWVLGTRLRTANGEVRANGRLDLEQGTDTDLRVRLDIRDLGEWWPIVGGEWAGSGPLAFEGRMTGRLTRPRFRARGYGSLAGVDMERFTLEGGYHPDRVDGVLRASGPGADSLFARVEMDPESGVGTLIARADSLRLDISPLGQPIRLRRVALDLSSQGYDVLHAGGEVSLQVLGASAWDLEADSLRAKVTAGDGLLLTREPLQVWGHGFALNTSGRVDVDRDLMDVRVLGGTREPSLPLRLAGVRADSGEVDLNIRLTGKVTDPDVEGLFQVRELVRNGLRAGSAEVRLDVDEVVGRRVGSFQGRLDSLSVGERFRLPEGNLEGRVRGDRITLQTITGRWTEGEATLRGDILVSADSLRARLLESRIRHREIDVRGLNGQVAVEPSTGAGDFEISAETPGGNARLAGYRDEEGMLFVSGSVDTLDLGRFGSSLDLPGAPTGVVTGKLEGRIAAHVEEMDARIRVDGPGIYEHVYENMLVAGVYRQGTVSLDTLDVQGEGGEYARISGTVHLPGAEAAEASGRLEMDLELGGVQLGPFASYLGRTLEGTLAGRVTTRGTFQDPRLEGRFDLQGAQVDTFQVDRARGRVRYDGARLRVEDGSLRAMGFIGSFQADVPVTLRFEPFTFAVDRTAGFTALFQGDGNPSILRQPFSKQIERLSGNLQADVTVDGTLERPDFQGRIQLHDGTLKASVLGQETQDLQVDLRLDRERIRVEEFTGRLPAVLVERQGRLARAVNWLLDTVTLGVFSRDPPQGDFALTGQVRLVDGRPRFDLALTGRGMGLSDPTASLSLQVDTDLALASDVNGGHPVLTGDVVVQRGIADVGLLLELTGGPETAGHVEEGERAAFEVNTDLEVPGRLRVVGGTLGQDVDVELEGNLLIRKEPMGSLYVLGTLNARPGKSEVSFVGRRWKVEEGEITFGNIEEVNPNLNVLLTTNVQDVRVTMTLTGTAREPITQLSTDSEALTSESDIWELLALGTSPFGQRSGQGGNAVTNFLESTVNRYAGQQLGVDTFEIEGMAGSTGENTQVTVGKYLTNQLYLRGSVGGQTGLTSLGEWAVEYRLSRRFTISGTRNNLLGRTLLELRWRIEY